MKQMMRYISVVVLLLCSTVMLAESKVEIAAMTNGTITGSLSGQTCTLTVTPAAGYYIRKSDITVQKTLDPSASRTRDEGIPVADLLSLSGDEPAAFSAQCTYTFDIPEGYNAYVTATFTACTAVTLTASIDGWTYGETAKTPSVTGNTGNATVAYTYAKKGSTDFAAAVPTAAGDYTLKASAPAIGIYTAAEATKDFTIARKAVTVTADAKKKVYGEDDPELTAVVTGTVGTDKVTYTLSRAEGENVGDYTITAAGESTQGNYTVTFAAGTLTISKAEGAVTAPTAVSGLVYSGAAQALITAGSTTTGTIQYSLDGKTYAETIPTGTDAGDYTVYYQVTPDANHTAPAAGSVEVSIARKAVTVTADAKTKVYGTADPTLTYTDTGLVAGESLSGALTRVVGENVGEYAINQGTLAATANYTLTFTAAKLTITKAEGAVTAPTAVSGLVFSGSAQALITAGSSTTGTIQYSLDGKTYAETIPTGTDAGDYTVYYKVTPDANHTAPAAGSVEVSIARKAVTVTADNQTKEAGKVDPTLTATVTGLVGSDKVTYTLSRAEGEEAGDYAITASGEATQGNYTVTFVAGKLTITVATEPDDPDNPDDPNNPDNPDDPNNPGTVVDENGGPVGNYGGKDLFELQESLKALIQQVAPGLNIALTIDATGRLTVTVNGEMTFSVGDDLILALRNLKKGDILKFDFSGMITGIVGKLALLNGTQRTRAAEEDAVMEIIAGAEYEVLEDGDLILTLKTETDPVVIRSITITPAGTTGISAVRTDAADTWYDLNGRRIAKPVQKGFYIHNGRTVVIR